MRVGLPSLMNKDEPEPAKNQRGLRGWLTPIVPVVSCLALVLSSWEFIRESRKQCERTAVGEDAWDSGQHDDRFGTGDGV